MENSKLSLLLTRLEAKQVSDFNDDLISIDEALSRNIVSIYSIGADNGCSGNNTCTGNTGCTGNNNCQSNTTCTDLKNSRKNNTCRGREL